MHFHFLFVDDTKNKAYKELESDYFKRLKYYCPVSVHVVKGERITKSSVEEAVKEKESERLLAKIPNGALIVVLDERGKQYTSKKLAEQVQEWQNRSIQHVAFVLGGPLGLSDQVRKKANLVLSLSKLTFVHEMARVVLVEQLYRAWTILRNEKYHK